MKQSHSSFKEDTSTLRSLISPRSSPSLFDFMDSTLLCDISQSQEDSALQDILSLQMTPLLLP